MVLRMPAKLKRLMKTFGDIIIKLNIGLLRSPTSQQNGATNIGLLRSPQIATQDCLRTLDRCPVLKFKSVKVHKYWTATQSDILTTICYKYWTATQSGHLLMRKLLDYQAWVKKSQLQIGS
jgi:hypothetical protein